MKILYIDTADRNEIKVSLNLDGKESSVSSKATILKSQAVMPLIDKVLKENGIDIKELNGINVNTGPGSFTGIRVGIAVANSLSYFLKIPVNGKKVGEIAEPVYN